MKWQADMHKHYHATGLPCLSLSIASQTESS